MPHIQPVAHHEQGSAKEGISDPPSVAVAFESVPETWVLPRLEDVED